MKRLAVAYPSPFKAVAPDRREAEVSYPRLTSEADLSDFKAALDSGRITPPDATKAAIEHRRARDFITATRSGEATPPPSEWASEFSLYHDGALAYRRAQPEAARKAWEALLALPEKERYYRTTWAEFMLGKLDLAEGKTTAAGERFRAVRKSAESGFADSLGLAASSYGWEALLRLNEGGLKAAAELYLTQLSTGDLSAIDSLKVIWIKADHAQAAADPLLRKIVTAGILCYSAPTSIGQIQADAETAPSSGQWLKGLETVGVDRLDEADRLGWIAYSVGRFEEAAQWLKKSDPNTALSLWLKAKLDFRAGRIAQATTAMQKALPLIPKQHEIEARYLNGDESIPRVVAQGDLGLLFLAGSDFEAAFHHFLKGGHWQDAAYIAERVLPLDVLRKLVDREFPLSEESQHHPNNRSEVSEADQIRALLARRLVRAGQLARARPYFSPKEKSTLDHYATALAITRKKSSFKEARAKAFLELAALSRIHGMELMGTELEPDAFIYGGMFEESLVWPGRLTGKYRLTPWSEENLETKPLVVPSGKRERELLKQSGVKPEKRFHYRYVAADYAWQAARLLPDNSEKTADVLNTAGGWLKKRDSEAADRFYQALERRCPDTEIGKAAIAIRWFPNMKGPWSETLKVD